MTIIELIMAIVSPPRKKSVLFSMFRITMIPTIADDTAISMEVIEDRLRIKLKKIIKILTSMAMNLSLKRVIIVMVINGMGKSRLKMRFELVINSAREIVKAYNMNTMTREKVIMGIFLFLKFLSSDSPENRIITKVMVS